MTPSLVAIHEPTDVAEARRRAEAIAGILGFDAVARGRAAIAVTEAGTNLLKHARGGGSLFVGFAGTSAARGLQLVAMDKGPGIRHLAASLRDGFSTAGTSGSGLGAIQRSSTTFDVYTTDDGTVLAATLYPDATPPLGLGALSVPITGETECGDGWAAWSAGALTSVFVCDGLGHGSGAAQAARAALETFRVNAERPAQQVIEAVHGALRPTRGAAVALAELDTRSGSMQYCGLGNIGAVIVGHDGREQHLISLSGIAGHVMRRLHVQSYPWLPGSTLVMHSDGLGTKWTFGRYPGLLARRPDVIAGVLLRDHARPNDDATVVVTAHGGQQ